MTAETQGREPKPGEWVLYRLDEKVVVRVAQVEKLTTSLVKFKSEFWPKQCYRLSVVASFAEKETAEWVRDSIAGVDGEFRRRKRAAEDERSRRITEALTAANRQVEALVATALAKAETGR